MDEDKEGRISQLLKEGLRYYGDGRMTQASECWREVLRLEPDHSAAQDYLRSAGRCSDEVEQTEVAGDEDVSLLADALELFRKGEAQESLEMLETLAREHPGRMDIQGYMELIRSHLFGYYRERVPDASRMLKVAITPQEMMRFNLPADAGFVLSMIDGNTSVNEILTLSGMDPFEAVRVVNKLLEAGIVEVSP
jgi:tetratricopeptide (TPR) repeat protein